jgi:CheY-like chemotaxis protein
MSHAHQFIAPEGGEHRTVLLVEDQDTIRRFAARVLERAGYRVLQAGDGHAALALIRAHDDIALVLTDIDLPDQSGYALARAARGCRDDIPVLYATGSPPTYDDESERPVAPVLSKPYDANGLLGAVERVLAHA